MKARFFTPRTIAGLGVLTAMVVVLQLLSNYVQFGPISITLALFPIAVGAMLYGPIGGFFLGLVDGALVLAAPSTISGFFALAPVGTIITCLGKTSIAGLIAGFIFKLYKRKTNVEVLAAIVLMIPAFIAAIPDIYSGFLATEPWGVLIQRIIRFALASAVVIFIFKGLMKPNEKSVVILTAISVPIINTTLFSVAAFTFFRNILLSGANAAGRNALYFLIFVWIGWNFFLEFGINAALAPAFHSMYKQIDKGISRRQ